MIFSSLCLKLRKTNVTNHITMFLKLRMFWVILVPLHLKLGLSGVIHTIMSKVEDARCHYYTIVCLKLRMSGVKFSPLCLKLRMPGVTIHTSVSEAEDFLCHFSHYYVSESKIPDVIIHTIMFQT